jgi:hypothetical protein
MRIRAPAQPAAPVCGELLNLTETENYSSWSRIAGDPGKIAFDFHNIPDASYHTLLRAFTSRGPGRVVNRKSIYSQANTEAGAAPIGLNLSEGFSPNESRERKITKFEDELLAIERHRHATKEGEDYKRRLKRLESKEVATINDIEFYSPKSETDLIALVSGLQVSCPELLPFVVRDYDSHFGFDGLATRSKQLAINETKHLFVEFKLELKQEFNHSFAKLDAILCWTSRLKDGEEVADLAGAKGTFKVTAKPDGKKDRFIMVPGSARNVEVIVYSELLEQNGYKFRPTGA